MTERWIDDTGDDREVKQAAALLRQVDDPSPPSHARARVWVELNNRTTPRVPGFVWTIAAVSAVALAALYVTRQEPTQAAQFAEIAAVEGRVQSLSGAAAAAKPAEAGQALASGERIRTSGSGRSTVRLHRVGRVEIEGESEIKVRGKQDGLRVELERGQVLATIKPRKARPPFSVTAGPWTVRVVGTVFQVTRVGRDHVIVKVEHGVVEVNGPTAKNVPVGAGETFISADYIARGEVEAPADKAKPPIVDTPVADGPDTDGPIADGPIANGPVADLPGVAIAQGSARAARAAAPPHAQPAKSRFRQARQADGRRKTKAARRADRAGHRPDRADRGANKASDGSARGSGRTGDFSSGSGDRTARGKHATRRGPSPTAGASTRERSDRASAPAPPKAPAVNLAVPSSALDDDDVKSADARFAKARGLNSPREQIKAFDAIVAEGGAQAELAGLRAALAAERIGQHGPAADRFAHLLRQHPRGGFIQEARLGLIRASLRIENIDRAKTELNRFLALHPASERRGDLRYLRGEIARREGRCDAAISDYRAAARSRHAQDALFFQGHCEMQTGLDTRARETLRTYLKQHPKGRHADDARKRLNRSSR